MCDSRQELRCAFITQPRLCINSGYGGRVNFCGSISQRRGGCQAVASLRGLRPPGPSGSSILLVWQMGTFVPEWRPKVFWLAILSSTAAGLRVPFYLASTSGCKEKVHLRLGTGSASGVTWGFFPFCQVSCRFPHKPAPQERGDCSLRSQTPLAAAPRWGLPARYFVCRQNIQACGRISRFFIGGYSALSHAYRFVPI